VIRINRACTVKNWNWTWLARGGQIMASVCLRVSARSVIRINRACTVKNWNWTWLARGGQIMASVCLRV
ncbi:hypothetical protein, partial [Salmonella enterica]|uniref:hypothetical protein n=1 Tax=Salmonella enterica TaxID=28901 RepID=UPI002EC9C67D|nr:hypothetical protein [Salmonella enterica subsp. enterica serovar Paratyphi A]